MNIFVITLLISLNFLPALSQNWPNCNPDRVTWHPHPYSCTKFVLCYYGNPLERLCAPGLHFNRITEQCMAPELAGCDNDHGCPSVDDPLNPVFLPNPEDCSAYFVCFEGSPIPRSCADGLWWDVVYDWCTIGEEVTCDDRTPNNPNLPGTTTTAPITTTTTTTPPTTTTPTTTWTSTPPTPTPDPNTMDCPLGSDPTFHPHTRDCSLYFICINGVAFLRECAPGTLFDFIERKCYDDEFASCISGTIKNPDLDFDTGVRESRPFTCPYTLLDEILLFPHEKRCDRYFLCQKGIAYLHFCKQGEVYDVKTEKCLDQSEADCFKDL